MNDPDFCSHCEAEAAIGTCSGCNGVAYCGTECQTEAWLAGGHAFECIGLQQGEMSEREKKQRNDKMMRRLALIVPFFKKSVQREFKRTKRVTEGHAKFAKKEGQVLGQIFKFGITKGKGKKLGRGKSPKMPRGKSPSRKSRSPSRGRVRGRAQESPK
jgi:hypothetical protein